MLKNVETVLSWLSFYTSDKGFFVVVLSDVVALYGK